MLRKLYFDAAADGLLKTHHIGAKFGVAFAFGPDVLWAELAAVVASVAESDRENARWANVRTESRLGGVDRLQTALELLDQGATFRADMKTVVHASSPRPKQNRTVPIMAVLGCVSSQ